MTNDIIAKAKAILAANDRGGYTVPTHGLYPFQWNWDSAFVAMGFALYDVDRALRELERLVEGQWADGMIPHIVFHAPADSYFPGPDVWGTRHAVPTSGITQPPVFALALQEIAARAPASFAPRVAALTAAAERYHRWFHAARDPDGTGLVATLHNWETGRDNSPEWDAPFSRVPETTTTVIRRKDTGHVDAAMRPSDQDYRRYIHIVDAYSAVGWAPEAMWKVAPFKVADVGTNAILLAAEEALAELAERFPEAADAGAARARAARLERGLASFWSQERGWFLSRDLIADAPLDTRVSAGLLPLLTSAATPERRKAMLATLNAHLDAVAAGVASTLPGERGFEPLRYWRGPVWCVVNLLIGRGLRRHGERAAAERLDRATVDLIATHGFGEYFDPLTGKGLGGADFSWTAAVALLLTQQSS